MVFAGSEYSLRTYCENDYAIVVSIGSGVNACWVADEDGWCQKCSNLIPPAKSIKRITEFGKLTVPSREPMVPPVTAATARTGKYEGKLLIVVMCAARVARS